MLRIAVVMGALLGAAGAPVAVYADQAAGVTAYEAGDYARAFREWRSAAEQGDILAMRNLGQLYRWGKGVDRDLRMAAEWYRRAADKGFEPAQLNLAFMYLDGQGVEANLAEAARWFELAALQRNPVAQYQLARLLEDGRGVPKDEERALLLYRLAAQSGLEHAKQRLAELQPLEGGVRVVRMPAQGPVAASGEVPPAIAVVRPVEPKLQATPQLQPQPQPESLAVEAESAPEAPLSSDALAETPVEPALTAPIMPEMPKAAEAAEMAPPSSASAKQPDTAEQPSSEPVAVAAEPAPTIGMAHLASYNGAATAESGWRILYDRHPEMSDLKPKVVQVDIPGKGTVFRLYAVGPRERLSELCRSMHSRSQFCRLGRSN